MKRSGVAPKNERDTAAKEPFDATNLPLERTLDLARWLNAG